MAFSLALEPMSNICNNNPQNPDINNKEGQTRQEETWDKGRYPKEFKVIALLEPKGLVLLVC